MRELEPLSFDRELRAAARELERRKITGEPLHDALPDRLQDEETLHWLRESRAKDPLAASLEGWLLRLREEAALGARRSSLARAFREDPLPITEPERTLLPLADMLRLSMARPSERAAYLRSFFASSTSCANQVRRLWEERQLFAEAHGTTLDSFEVCSAAIEPATRHFIASSEGAFETLDCDGPERLMTTALAESAQEGWPARLTARSTLDLLGDSTWTHGLRLRQFALPQARGASSFMLSLGQAGRAISDAASTLRSPFVLATDVFDLRRSGFGALLALLPMSHAFAKHRLRVSPSRARDQQRALARAVLVDLRVAAFRVQLRGMLMRGDKAIASELPESSHGALGFELPQAVAGVFIRARPRDAQRFAGALWAASRHETLVQSHDEDWFRDPRALAELRAELSEPAPEVPSDEALAKGGVAALAQLHALL